MITYKPSSRLGTLNEELFTSDPTTRGWTVSGTLYSFDATGCKLTLYTLNVGGSATLTLNTKLQQYISFSLNGIYSTYPIVNPKVEVYFNGNLVDTFTITAGDTNGGEYHGVYTLFKNKDSDWRSVYALHWNDSSGGDISYNNSSINIGLNSVSELKLVLSGSADNHTQSGRTLSLTDVRWV